MLAAWHSTRWAPAASGVKSLGFQTETLPDSDLSPEVLATLDRAIQEAMIGNNVAEQRLNRLVTAVFADPAYAGHRLRQCLRDIGAEPTINILEGRSLHSRTHLFGLLRGLTKPRWLRSARVCECLAELPEAIREREMIGRKLSDLRQGRQDLRQRVPGREPLQPVRDIATGQSRPRSR